MYCVAAVVYYWILHALVDLSGWSICCLGLSASDWSANGLVYWYYWYCALYCIYAVGM